MGQRHHDTCFQGARQFGFDASIFYDVYANPGAAAYALGAAINDAWYAGDAMYIIGAGPMESIYQGLLAANPGALSNVTVISHSTWNNQYGGSYNFPGYPLTHTSDDIAALGVAWNQIATQVSLNSPSGYDQYAYYYDPSLWIWDSYRYLSTSSNPALNWLWGRMVYYEGRPDVSDAGMVYYFFTGNQSAVPADLQAVLDSGGSGPSVDAPATVSPSEYMAVTSSGASSGDWIGLSDSPCDGDWWTYGWAWAEPVVYFYAPASSGTHYVSLYTGAGCVSDSFQVGGGSLPPPPGGCDLIDSSYCGGWGRGWDNGWGVNCTEGSWGGWMVSGGQWVHC
jgi:hypothetical protein